VRFQSVTARIIGRLRCCLGVRQHLPRRSTSLQTILCMRCPGMSSAGCRCWLVEPGHGRDVIWPYRLLPQLRSCFRSTLPLAGTSSIRRPEALATLWMHFFWIFGIRSLRSDLFRPSRLCIRDHSSISRKPIFGYPVMVAANDLHWFIGLSVWAHHSSQSG